MAKVRMLRPVVRAIDARTAPLPPKLVDPFYHSPEWRALCGEIRGERWPRLMEKRGHCCEDPECQAVHTASTRIFFDHVIERRDRPELQLMKSNIIGRCGSSHTRKTAEERRQRAGGG